MNEASEEEQEICYSTINKAINKPGILRVVKPFAKNFVPKMMLPDYPKPITGLYNPSALLLKYPELLKECETVCMSYKVLLYILYTSCILLGHTLRSLRSRFHHWRKLQETRQLIRCGFCIVVDGLLHHYSRQHL